MFNIMGDGFPVAHLSHVGIDFCYNKRPKHLKTLRDAIYISKRMKLIKSSYMVLNLIQAFSLQMCSGWSLVSPKKSPS